MPVEKRKHIQQTENFNGKNFFGAQLLCFSYSLSLFAISQVYLLL